MCHYQISLTVGYALYVGNRDHIRLMSTENWVFLLRAAFGPSAQSAWSSLLNYICSYFWCRMHQFSQWQPHTGESGGKKSLVLSSSRESSITDEEGNIATQRRNMLTLKLYLAAILFSDWIHHTLSHQKPAANLAFVSCCWQSSRVSVCLLS